MVTFYDSLSKIEKWINDKDFTLIRKSSGYSYIDLQTKEVVINFSIQEDRILSVLLHECGHLSLLFDSVADFNYNEIRDSEAPDSVRLKIYRIAEEIDAWKESRKICQELDIEIPSSWENEFISSVKKYAKII